LLVSAGLLIRSFLQLLATDPGFNSESLLTMNLVLPAAKYKEEPQRVAFYSDLVRRVEELPGVASAALVSHLPLGGSNSSSSFLVEGLPEPPPGQEFEAGYRVCTPGYFPTMGIAVRQGRGFTEQDKAGAPLVIIVNETLARKYWPNSDAIGRRLRYTGPLDKNPWLQVVGVVQDVKHELNLPVTPDFYVPHAQDAWASRCW
jgi:MacB-like periplasmic core domain